jgi:hypothetical protein
VTQLLVVHVAPSEHNAFIISQERSERRRDSSERRPRLVPEDATTIPSLARHFAIRCSNPETSVARSVTVVSYVNVEE